MWNLVGFKIRHSSRSSSIQKSKTIVPHFWKIPQRQSNRMINSNGQTQKRSAKCHNLCSVVSKNTLLFYNIETILFHFWKNTLFHCLFYFWKIYIFSQTDRQTEIIEGESVPPYIQPLKQNGQYLLIGPKTIP